MRGHPGDRAKATQKVEGAQVGVRGEVADTAVLQAAMPTAVVSAIIAANAGCDARLASAAAVVTTLLSLLTLPLVVVILRAL